MRKKKKKEKKEKKSEKAQRTLHGLVMIDFDSLHFRFAVRREFYGLQE